MSSKPGNIANVLGLLKNYIKSVECEIIDQQTFRYKLKGRAPVVNDFEVHLTIEILRGDILPLLLYKYCKHPA